MVNQVLQLGTRSQDLSQRGINHCTRSDSPFEQGIYNPKNQTLTRLSGITACDSRTRLAILDDPSEETAHEPFPFAERALPPPALPQRPARKVNLLGDVELAVGRDGVEVVARRGIETGDVLRFRRLHVLLLLHPGQRSQQGILFHGQEVCIHDVGF